MRGMDLAHIRNSVVKYLLFFCLLALIIFLILNPNIAKPPDEMFIQNDVIINRGKNEKPPESPNKQDLLENAALQNIVNSNEDPIFGAKKKQNWVDKVETTKKLQTEKVVSTTKRNDVTTTSESNAETTKKSTVATTDATSKRTTADGVATKGVTEAITAKNANETSNEVHQSPLKVSQNFTRILLANHLKPANNTQLRSKRKPQVKITDLMDKYASGDLRIDDLMDILESSSPSTDEEEALIEKPEAVLDFEKGLNFTEVEMQFKNFRLKFNITTNQQSDCENATALVMIMSTGSKNDYFQRLLIRYTYLGKTAPKHICHRFVIGFQPEMDIASLKKEMAEFNDIVYYNVYDTYRRNFIKWFTMYAWQQKHASDVPILFKLDSDTAIDLKRTFHWLLRRFDTDLILDDGWIVCEKMENQQPVRSPKTNAWYVPVREYAYDLYPPYCYGYAVIMSTLAVNLSIDAMKEVAMFHMDDVLYTGVVAPLRDIQLYDFKGIRTQISGHVHEARNKRNFCKNGLPYPIALHNAKSPTSMHYSYELLRKIDCITNPNAYHKRPFTFYEN